MVHGVLKPSKEKTAALSSQGAPPKVTSPPKAKPSHHLGDGRPMMSVHFITNKIRVAMAMVASMTPDERQILTAGAAPVLVENPNIGLQYMW